MDLLSMIEKKEFNYTGERKRLEISGEEKFLYDVYAIPVDYLYYNDQNGRINTTYMKYKAEKGELEPEIGDSKYNNIFEKFIKESNIPALKKTQQSIKEKGQQEPGVVLPDGRIIDGNRRFTSLRMLQKEDGIPKVFHAIVLPLDNKTKANKKNIKTLELDLQLGREEKVSYDPIDRIFDVYDTIKIRKQMTAQEYRKAAGFGNAGPINRDIKLAELIIKFIKIVSPTGNLVEKFYLARDLKLDGPMEEIDKTIDNLKSKNKESIIDAILIHMLLTKTGIIKDEPTKAMRDLKNNVINKPEILEYFLNSVDDKVDIIIDAFEERPIKSTNDINVIFEDEEVANAAKTMVKTTKDLIYKGGLDTERTRVLAQLIDIRDKLDNVNTQDFNELQVDEKIEVREVISEISDIIYKTRKGL